MPDTTLPPDLLPRARQIILPLVGTEDEREALLTDAFYLLPDSRLYHQIQRDGSAMSFTTLCIRKLIDYGCIMDDVHALGQLLGVARLYCGVEKHAEIDALVAIANARCLEALPVTTSEAPPVAVVARPDGVLSIDTPHDERRPTVFISYSHDDEAFAQRLIADLNTAGHVCWIDTSAIKGGADWQRAICDGINLSYALVVVCTEKALTSEYVWDEIQWARTRRKLIIPVLVEDVTSSDRFFGLHRFQGIRFDRLSYAEGVAELLDALPAAPAIDPTAPRRVASRREHELAYLDRLRFDDFRLEKFEIAEYAPLGGVAQIRQAASDVWEALSIKQEFAVLPQRRGGHDEVDAEPEAFTDAVSKITEIRRVVVLGEPGAGKTHTLRAIAKPLYTAALSDPVAPIPLLVKLGNWDKADEPFEAFLRGALGELGTHLDELLADQRAVLLLDGLNEFPADQRRKKYPQVEGFIKAHGDVRAVVTCREADYPISLGLSRVLIRPLDSLRIRDFARRALRAVESDDAFFWKLVGEEARRFETRFKTRFADKMSDWESVFWLAAALPGGLEWKQEFIDTFYYSWSRWLAIRDNPSGILTLARNPYMLRMLLDVYIQFKGVLPPNRGQLFDQFVNVLLEREKLASINVHTNVVTVSGEGQALLDGLQRVAFRMQVRRMGQKAKEESSAGTALDLFTVREILNERLLYLAVSTSILNMGDEVRFTHQLLQEYFAAKYMQIEIMAGRLDAGTIWERENWWERTNWEEAVILLAGLYSDDCGQVLEWVNASNPEVASMCVVRSGAALADETVEKLRGQWLLRLTDEKREPEAKARAAIGRALGLANWDSRRGVNVTVVGGLKVPDIDWVEIPDDGEWTYQKDKHPGLPAFRISRYPVTYGQFQVFIDDNEGFYKARWWDGMGIADGHNKAPGDQAYKYWNHPRERVSWYDAIAFCRWLSDKLGYEVTLPTEQQWEKAARGTDGREYPYEGAFDAAKGNTEKTGIGQTSAVGIFPSGASPYGVLDMSGNVWEWCLTKYETPDEVAVDASGAMRVLRGGSWNIRPSRARTVYRISYGHPSDRDSRGGFRVCVPLYL